MSKAICEVCGNDRPNCGPWKDANGKRWVLVCGSCKIEQTLGDPARRARFEAETSMSCTRMIGEPVLVRVEIGETKPERRAK